MSSSVQSKYKQYFADQVDGEETRISRDIDTFINCRSMGIAAMPDHRELKNILQTFIYWSQHMQSTWNSLNNDHANTPQEDYISVILQKITESDLKLLENNDDVPEITRKTICWAAYNTAQSIIECCLDDIKRKKGSDPETEALSSGPCRHQAYNAMLVMLIYPFIICSGVDLAELVSFIGNSDSGNDALDQFYTEKISGLVGQLIGAIPFSGSGTVDSLYFDKLEPFVEALENV